MFGMLTYLTKVRTLMGWAMVQNKATRNYGIPDNYAEVTGSSAL